MTSKVAITGASGNIGQRLLLKLRPEFPEIAALSRTSQADVHGAAVNWVIGDLARNVPPRQFLSEAEILIHLAGVLPGAGVTDAQLSDNARIAENLIAAVRQDRPKFIINISSIAVSVAEAGRANARAYGVSKMNADRVLLDGVAQLNDEVQIVTLRPPAIYGRDFPGPVNALSKMIKKKIPLPLGAAKQPRSYMSVENLCDLIVDLVKLDNSARSRVNGAVFEPSDGNAVSTADLCRMMGQAANKPAKLFPLPESLVRFVGRISGRKELVSGAFDEQVSAPIKIVTDAVGWKPVEQMPESLIYLKE